MSGPTRTGECVDCHRTMAIARTEGGVRCARCAEHLPRTQCVDCRRPIPDIGDAEPRCRPHRLEHQWKGVVCFRCQQVPNKRQRAFLPDGRPVCASCKSSYLPPVECHLCHEWGTRRSRNYALGLLEPTCRKCMGNAEGLVTCAGCRRFRHPAGTRENGKIYCAACLRTGHPPLVRCTDCKQRKPEYTYRCCVDCSWERSHQALIERLAPAFKTDWARQLFADYHREAHLKQKQGRWRNALKRDVVFFLALEKVFTKPEEMTGVGLIERLGWMHVRAYRRVCSYLAHRGLVVLDADPDYKFAAAVDKVRHQALTHQEPWIARTLQRFLAHVLQLRAGANINTPHGNSPLKRKSLEFAMLKAQRLMEYARDRHQAMDARGISQSVLDRYLAKHTSDHMGVVCFIDYLNTHEKLFHRLRVPKKGTPAIPAHLILPDAHRRASIDRLVAAEGKTAVREALFCLFNLVYAQMDFQTARMRLNQVTETDRGFSIRFAERDVTLDPDMVPLMQRWLVLRRELSMFDAAGASPYLFPGMRTGTHIHPTAVQDTRRALRLPSRAGRATAIHEMIRNGLVHPKILSECFGLSLGRAHQYCMQLGAHQFAMAKIQRGRHARGQ
ncbi:MAG: hypothetical protein ACREO3_07155 [Arenimonas sp.]